MLYAEPRATSITTVLGSCISVCIWDTVLRVGGMNHYLLPFWNGEGLQTPKYGNIAIPMLIDKLLSQGCRKANLVAKLFGGSSMLESFSGLLNVGERNIAYAESTLADSRIPVSGKDTGGNSGRKVMFLSGTGDVFVKKSKAGILCAKK